MTFGGFPLAVVRGKDGVIRCFHNVCRHRAYKVFEESSGVKQFPQCRYHNWTYDSTGKFKSAKEFAHLEGFHSEDKNLFEVETKTNGGGLWIRLEMDDWESQSDSLVKNQDELDVLDMSDGLHGFEKAKVVESWYVEGQFNWKVVGKS
jgi:phenylpropionate dioxygenase-like ring-hydroxylating dioxygenase large terminal subunit